MPVKPKQNFTLDEGMDIPVVNEFAEGLGEEIPADIDNFLIEHNIQNLKYTCTIQRYPDDGVGTPRFVPGQWKGEVPKIAEIGAKFGPGRYLFVFSYGVSDENGKRKTQCIKKEIVLDDEWEDAHQEYIYQVGIARNKKLRIMRAKREQERILHGDDIQQPQDALSELHRAKDALTSLGVPVGHSGHVPATQDNSMMALVIQMQQKSSEMMFQMMSENQKSMIGLFTVMMQNNNNGSSYTEAMKEAMAMVTQVVDLKQALNPEKAGLVDRIFEFLQTMGPQVTAILAQPRAQARQDPMVKIAKDRPEVQQMMADQGMMDAFAQKLDAEFGIKQANEILDVMGMERSQALKDHLKKGGYSTEPEGPPMNPDAAQDAEIVESGEDNPDMGGEDIED